MSDLIDRQAAIDAIKAYLNFADWKPSLKEILEMAVNDVADMLGRLPSAQPEHLVKESGNLVNGLVNDCISRQDVIRWIKIECNPYGSPTLDFESGKKVIAYLERMPTIEAQPEQIARDIVTIIENEKDMRVISKNAEHTETHSCDYQHTETHDLVSRDAVIKDYARLGYQISTFDNCNDCGNKKDCPYTPKPGAMVRWNCPLWKSEVKE